MNSVFDMRRNCVRIKADIKGTGIKFRGSGVLYPLSTDVGYDYVLTAQHILKAANNENLSSQLGKLSSIVIEVFEDKGFTAYNSIAKEDIGSSLLPIGDDFLIIRINKGEKQFNPFHLADDLIEEKSMHLYGISGMAQDVITRLDCKCVDMNIEMVNVTSPVDNMDSLHGMSGGGVFAINQPLMYGVLWKYAATDGEFHNVHISQALENQISEQLAARGWEDISFINIAQCKHAMCDVYNKVFHDINDTILVNRRDTTFPLEARFVMPDFIDDMQSLRAEDLGKPDDKKEEDMEIMNFYIKSSDIQEYGERYLKEFYSQLNKTSNKELRIPASSVLTPDRKILLIVGGPGSGKSSLLKILTLNLLKGRMTAYEGYLPVWMPFSYMARYSDSDIKSIIRAWLEEVKLWEKYSCYLEYAFEQQKILLIADGIDEWGDEPLQADQVIRKVKAETEAGKLLAVFSSREYGIANINSPFSTSDTYTIAPLSASQQDELVKNCVEHYNGLISDTKRTAVFLSAKLRILRDVDRMKENPMLLTILISQYLQGNELPHNNITAMDCIVDQLFVKHQQSRKYQAYDYSKSFDYTSNRMLLGVLSKEMFDYYNDGSMDKTQAEVLLNQYLNSQTNGQELNNAHLVDDLFSHDTHQLGVIEERTGSRISFINRQLQEFMTARYLSLDDRKAKAFIKEHAFEMGMHQVVLFLFEMMPASSFVELYQALKPITTNDYRDYYLYKLKLEVLVRSIKAPKQFLLKEIEEYIRDIEWSSDYDTKHDLLEILLDGLYNTALVGRVEEFLSKYLPTASVYHDIRLSGLMQVPELTAEERQFVVQTVLNGDVSNKILASEVLRKHVLDDEILLELVNNYITPNTMPEVVAFFLRSIIVDGIDVGREDELISKVVAGDIYTRFYQMEFSLFKEDVIDEEDYLGLVSELPYTLNNEAFRVLIDYYANNEIVRKKALISVTDPFREHKRIDRDIAWRYLLTCWLNHPDTIKAIEDELKETYPFNSGSGRDLWGIIQKQAVSPELLKVITEWAVSRDKKEIMWSVNSTTVNTLVVDPRIKTKLLEALDGMTSYQHLVVYPLLENWRQDADVIERLQRCLEEDPLESSSWIAGYAYKIYQGDDNRIKAYLDRCINDANGGIMKDRAVSVYISHYKDEFAEKYLQRILRGEIAMSDHVLGSKWGILEAIIDNYSERQDVKDYLLRNYSDDYKFAGQIIVKYHGTELASRMIRRWYHMDTRLRLMMIHKISSLSSIDEHIESLLNLYQQEGNAYVLCDMVLCLVNHLKRAGRDAEVFRVAEKVFKTAQVTTEYAYKMRFCIYLMYHKLDEYIQLKLSLGGKEYEFAQFHLFNNDSPYIEKTIADEADYLLSDDMENLKTIIRDDKGIYDYIKFFSKYVSPTSEAARSIVKYLLENKSRIDDANILLFLKKVGDQKALLKELIIANIDNTNSEMSATLAKIIASDYEDDEDIQSLLKLDKWMWNKDSLNRVALNCSLNTNVKKLQAIFSEFKENEYELDSRYATYNFIFSMIDDNKVVDNLKYYLTELQDTYVYRMIVTPLTMRLKRDRATADKIYEELMLTEDPRIRVGFYTILSSAGVKTTELRYWRNQQREHIYDYGHDIVQNRDRQLITVFQ